MALLLPPLGALLVVVFLLALVDTPLSAAVGRCIPAVVADDDLVAANAMRSAVAELGTVLGPPLAGLLFAVSGTRLVLGLDALTFLAVIPLALRLPTLARDTNGRSRPSFFRDARDGLAFIRHTPYVLAVAVGFWIVVLFSAPDDLILPFLATVTFKAGPVAVGVLLAAASAGLLAGLPLVGPAGRRLGVTGAIVAGFAVMATGNLLTAAAPWLMAAFAAQVLRGLAIPLADSHVTTYLQRTTPPAMLGRVLANVYGGVGVAAAVGYLLGGPVLDATSPRTAFVIVGCGGLAGAAVTALLLRRRLGLGRRGQDRDPVPGGGLGQRGEIRRSVGWRGQGRGQGGLTDLGGELLEPGRGVQGEEPRGGGGDDVGVAKAPGQHRDGAGPGGVLLLAGEYPQFAVEHEEGLVVPVVDVDGAGVAARGEVVGQGEGPAGLRAADAHLGQGAQEPDGRLDVRIGDHAAGHGRDGVGHGGAPSRAGGRIART